MCDTEAIQLRAMLLGIYGDHVFRWAGMLLKGHLVVSHHGGHRDTMGRVAETERCRGVMRSVEPQTVSGVATRYNIYWREMDTVPGGVTRPIPSSAANPPRIWSVEWAWQAL